VESYCSVTIDAVVPAYNEEQRIGKTLTALLSVPNIGTVIVVDDGSSDRTSDVASQFAVKVIRLAKNQGKSAALMAGVKESQSEFILMVDADLGESAKETSKLIAAYPKGENACVVAKFPVVPGRGGGLGLAVRLARNASLRFGRWMMDAPLSGQRLLRRDTLTGLFPLPYGFGLETSLNIRLGRAGVHLVEVDTQMDHRVTQNDLRGRMHRAKQLIHLIMAIARECNH
jgi:glycosyltransferase involved in cell wall biosynthesis